MAFSRAAACGAFLAIVVLPLTAQQPTFRVGTRLVSIFATVTDAQQRLVPNLAREDFEILDDGKPQPVEFFLNEVQPITVMVAALNGQRIVPFPLLNAVGVLAAALPAAIALVLNRYIVQGVMAGSIK